MTKLPSIKRLAVEDFAGQKDWIGKLFAPINQFFESIASALNGGLTFADNMSAVVRSISVPNGSASFPLYFSWGKKVKPIGLWVVNARETSGTHTNFSSAISADWEYTTDGLVKINAFPGLPTSTGYTVTVVAITG